MLELDGHFIRKDMVNGAGWNKSKRVWIAGEMGHSEFSRFLQYMGQLPRPLGFGNMA